MWAALRLVLKKQSANSAIKNTATLTRQITQANLSGTLTAKNMRKNMIAAARWLSRENPTNGTQANVQSVDTSVHIPAARRPAQRKPPAISAAVNTAISTRTIMKSSHI